MPNGKRAYIPRELRLLSEFLAQEFPKDRILTQVRLGTIHPDIDIDSLTPAELRMLGLFRRFADAIVVKPDRLILIEAAIRPDPGDISKLELYESLIPHTLELEEHSTKPVQKMIVWSIPDTMLASIAREHGVIVREFHPSWVDEYLLELSHRNRRATKSGIQVSA